jgi:hypothetical protein
VAYNNKDILGVAKVAYYDISNHFAMSFLSTNKDYYSLGISKKIADKMFSYFSKEHPNEILNISGYSISGWKFLRKTLLKYSLKYNVKIKEKPIEYITDWSKENRDLFNKSREIIPPEY